MLYFWSHCGNTITSSYAMSWIGFWPPLIVVVFIFVHNIILACLPRCFHLLRLIYFNQRVLLCYNLCQSLLAYQFLSNFWPIPDLFAKIPCFYTKVPPFYANIFLFGFHCAINLCGRVPLGCLWSILNDGTLAMRGQRGRAEHIGGKTFCTSVHAK